MSGPVCFFIVDRAIATGSFKSVFGSHDDGFGRQEFAFDTETNSLRALGDNKDFKLVGISISWGAYNNYYIPVGHVRDEDISDQLDLDVVVRYLKPVFERTDVRIIGHNLRPVYLT